MGWGVTRSTTSPRRTATSLASKSASLILACLFVRVVLYDYLIDAGVCVQKSTYSTRGSAAKCNGHLQPLRHDCQARQGDSSACCQLLNLFAFQNQAKQMKLMEKLIDGRNQTLIDERTQPSMLTEKVSVIVRVLAQV